ncbi:MAG: 16S rRNA (adenine(1518)-N(6)/adenine(1519)-N(6))-dimethyltransferase RsmA [archaeon]|nr:16S rRNA (adenine(1518)-N(6)/adenine(1519)-N(6))-dimethyltransferase RsmA [archaeon]
MAGISISNEVSMEDKSGTSQLGQHFMTDTAVTDKIMQSARIKKDETILEIGAGTGILTEEIAKAGRKVISYEIDRRFEKDHKALKERHPNITFIYKDAISSDLPSFDRIIANIPYNISEPLMLKLSKTNFKEGILTVNKSFADKILGTSKTGSLLSLVMPAYFKLKYIAKVPKTAFTPKPRVKSSIIRITPIKKEDLKNDAERYIIRLLYDQRTKKAGNALMEAVIDYRTIKDSDFTRKCEVAHASRHLMAKPLDERISDSCKSPRYTKKESKTLLKKSEIDEKILEKRVIMLSYPELEKIISLLSPVL